MRSTIRQFWIGFSTLFIIFLPFPYFVFSGYSLHIKSFWNPIIGRIAHFIQPDKTYYGLESDSFGMHIWLSFIFVIAIVITALVMKSKKLNQRKLEQILTTFLAYFLGYILIKYGFDKILVNQFTPPESNILYSKLGDLEKDILYWSAMGTSPLYSIFLGILEIIPGLFLFFRRTRALGAFVGSFIFLNVLFINLGFNIDVKLLSSFLLGLSLFLGMPVFKAIVHQFIRLKNYAYIKPEKLVQNMKLYSGLKIVVIMLIIIDVSGSYLSAKSENWDEFKGAYLVEFQSDYFKQVPKRFHIHKDGYLIVEYYDNYMEDYKLKAKGGIYDLFRNNELAVEDIRFVKSKGKLVLFSEERNAIFLQGRFLSSESLALTKNKGFNWVAY